MNIMTQRILMGLALAAVGTGGAIGGAYFASPDKSSVTVPVKTKHYREAKTAEKHVKTQTPMETLMAEQRRKKR